MMEKHPGYLGLTSQGVIAIHADWPAYPAEHGWDVALVSLGSFEEGTHFRAIDDIDRCVLFLGWEPPRGLTNPRDEEGMHVAVWHEDLLDLAAQGLIHGVEAITERDWERNKRAALRDDIRKEMGAPEEDAADPLDLLYVRSGSKRSQMRLPDLEGFDDEEREFVGLSSSDRTISLTKAGWGRLDSLLSSTLDLPPSLEHRIRPLLSARLFDTAVREAAVCLESRMRSITRTDRSVYGLALVEAFTKQLRDSSELVPSQLRVLRGELRTAFKFVRNGFAHEVAELPEARGLALVSRLCHLLSGIESIGNPAQD